MTRAARRRLLVGAALAGLSAAAASASAPQAPPSAQPASAAFTPPRGSVLFTRELRKILADGKEIVSRRRYAIRFEPAGSGFRVEGRLIGADVTAPAELAQLAEVERTRSDEGMFPLVLDREGLIVRQPGGDDPGAAERTIAAARAFLARSNLPEEEQAAALAMAAKLQAQARAAGGTWPADLFRPSSGQSRASRDLSLPDGSSGRVTVTITASKGTAGTLEQLRRDVVTELDGTERLSTETWTLAAL
ncbi:MAG: hypothetical protein V4579_11285 [Pseudomonadota bacterium]